MFNDIVVSLLKQNLKKKKKKCNLNTVMVPFCKMSKMYLFVRSRFLWNVFISNL